MLRRQGRSWALPERTAVSAKHRRGESVAPVFKSFVNDESGQDLIEYALLAGFISLVAVVAITNVGTGVNLVYGGINTQVGLIPTP